MYAFIHFQPSFTSAGRRSVSNHGNSHAQTHTACPLDEPSNLFDCWSIKAAGPSNLHMEIYLTRNEETWWLVLLWVNRRHISSASKDLVSLLNSDTDVEFPLFCFSWVHASASAAFCLCVLPLPCKATFPIHYHSLFESLSSSLSLTYD